MKVKCEMPETLFEITLLIKKEVHGNTTFEEIERELLKKGWEIVQIEVKKA